MKYIVCFGIFLLLPRLIAQENGANDSEPEDSGVWLGLGIGANHFGPTLYASGSFLYDKHILTVRYLKADEAHISFGEAYDFDDPPLSIREIGILYGRSLRKQNAVLSLSGGIGILDGQSRGKWIAYKEYEKISMAGIGMSFEAEVRFEFMNALGISGSFFGNLNNKKTFTGGMVKISIGKFM